MAEAATNPDLPLGSGLRPAPQSPGTPNALPVQLSSFIGRDADIARGIGLLASGRLLTITGSGGCGKTRLAEQIASRVSERYGSGVWWVDLASVSDDSLLPETIAAAVGVTVPTGQDAVEAISALFGSDPALVVFDNCEHLVAGLAHLADRLLRAAPCVTVLATSREPLAIEGEVTWRIPSLSLPDDPDRAPEILERFDAIRLFVERAAMAKPTFELDERNGPAVARICDRLDGIPLAIELAAARIRFLPPDRIAEALDDRFGLLTSGSRAALMRHQTLLASIEWSHALLDDKERILFRRLGVFAGSFALDAAETVAAGEPLGPGEVRDVLSRLVDKSLVQADDSRADVRYRLLETIRQYAVDRLQEAGETEAFADRQLEWARRLVTALEPGTTNAHPGALNRLDEEYPNVRAGLEWASRSDRQQDALGLVSSLALFWTQRGHYREAAHWADRVIDTAPHGAPGLARARWGRAYVSIYAGDMTTAFEQAALALDEARAAGDEATAARCLHTVNTALVNADPTAARPGLTEAASLARRAEDLWCLADSLQMIAYAHLIYGEYELAVPLLEESFGIVERLDNDMQRAWHHAGIGWAEMDRGELEAALREIELGISIARRVGDPSAEVICGSILSTTLLVAGDLRELASRVAEMTARRREWGFFGDTFIPAWRLMGLIADDPARARDGLDAISTDLFGAGAAVQACGILIGAAVAALEADDPAGTVRLLAARASIAPPSAFYRAWGDLLHGAAARLLGEPAEAETLVHAALSELTARKISILLPLAVETLGGLALVADSPDEAARLLAAADTRRTTTGQRRLPGEQRRFDKDVATVRRLLADRFDAVWSEGASLSEPEAVAYARRARGSRRRPSAGWASLTPTEARVVELVTEGLTNPEIGERLFIGRGTVKTHLSHVFAKLGVKSRAELAALAAKR